MNFYRRSDLTADMASVLTRYDETIRRFVGPDYSHPIRMRDWELARVLGAMRSVPVGSSVLDTGSYNTYLPLALAASGYRLTASDLIWRRMVKSLERRLGLAPAKETEAPFFAWLGVYLLVTTDCTPEPSPYSKGVRYFSEAELEGLFAPYNLTSARNRPDFDEANWCYGLGRPVVTAFAEITKLR